MLIPEDAWTLIADRLETRPGRRLSRQAAVGTVLAEDLAATVDMPPADVSAMDGYACAGAMPAGQNVAVVGTVAAGEPPAVELAPGTACKIMTGAVVPPGADRVIPVEQSLPPLIPPGGQSDGGSEAVVFTESGTAGRHIRRGGEVTRRGEHLLAAGTHLTPGAVSLLASHGYGEVLVRPLPKVAVLVTGDELVEPDQEPGPAQLRDSNSAFLLAAGTSLGLAFTRLGIAPDRLDELRAAIARGLESEVLLLSGGVSMGEFDLVEDALAELGCEKLFDKVAIQPGKPLVAARHPGGWVFGLPGNPASVMATFWLFVRPLLRCLLGHEDGFWHGALAAELAAPLPGAKGRDRFLPAEVRARNGRLHATPLASRGSHDVAAYAHGTALLRIRPDAVPATAGECCEVLPFAHWIV